MKAKLFLSLFLLTGFFIYSQTGTTIVDSFFVGGKWRSYRIYKPNIYTGTTSVPLILNFHGYTSNAFQQQYYGNFMPVADTANFIIVHPQGTNDPVYNTPYWNAGIYGTGVNDVQFITQLIDTIKAGFNIDPNAVYSTGLSNGGFMSNYLACNLSNKIAAIASVAGTMFTGWYGSCSPGRPVPVLHIHGTSDPTVPYSGSSTVIHADTLVKYWVKNTNCNPVPTFSNVPNVNTGDGCTATHYVYSGGTSGAGVELYKINNGGHTWPGTTFSVGVTCMDFNGSAEIWRFFRKYKLSTLTSVSQSHSEISFIIFPNPVNDMLTVNINQSFSVSVFDVLGKEVLSGADEKQISFRNLSSGIYYLQIRSGDQLQVKKIIKE
jgi:polyhydroxybutyrate depolymerase